MERAAGISPDVSGGQIHVTACDNRLVGRLGRDDQATMFAPGEVAIFGADVQLARSGEAIGEVYFPVSGYASLMISGTGDPGVQVALVGREGVLGWESLLGRNTFLLDIYVPEALQALRLDLEDFRMQASVNQHWRLTQMAYLARLIKVTARGVLCARFHLLEARLARCLLEVNDRRPGLPILLTQSTLAMLLGVRRSGVTNAATHLQLLGLIQYRRGEIRLLDRRGLEAAACECYRHDIR